MPLTVGVSYLAPTVLTQVGAFLLLGGHRIQAAWLCLPSPVGIRQWIALTLYDF
jgi:hypothetical protein